MMEFIDKKAKQKPIAMKNEKLKELSTEKLEKKLKSLKVIAGILASSIILLALASIFFVDNDRFNFAVVLPVIFMPNLFINIIFIKKIKKEIESRKQ